MSPPHYNSIIDDIVARLTVAKPKTMLTVNNIIKRMRSGDASWYGLIVGEIQSGKTPAQMILTWLFARHYEFLGHVCFVTKSLDSIRRDVMGKFKSDLINQHIIAAGEAHGILPAKALEEFGLTYHIYTDKKVTVKELGKPGQVELMLMQKNNYEHIRMWLKERMTAPVLFLVDEIHELYNGSMELVPQRGLSIKYGHSASMLHWFQKQMLNERQRCYMVGVTATPYAPMTADPICWPTEVFHLETDAPAPGLTYYGYHDHALKGVKMSTYDADVSIVDMDAIQQIMSRSRGTLANGNTEVPFICLTTHQYNEIHHLIESALKKEYGERVNILVFNQDNSTTLDSWFKEHMLTQEVCETGCLVIIGKACMAAGITVKPTKSLIATWNGVTYQVTGITDQFMPATNINVTSTKQLMRILGWFPDGHRATLWVDKEELFDVYRYELGDITSQFLKAYDPEVGSISVKHINVKNKRVKTFYENSPYRVTKRHGNNVHISADQPENFNVSETVHIKIPDTSDLADLRLEEIENTEVMKQVRMGLGFTRFTGGKNGDFIHIATNEKDYQFVLSAAAQPKPKSSSNINKVNGFLWGAEGIKTKLKNCYLVKFKESWHTRPVSTYQTPDKQWVKLILQKEFTHNMIEMYDEACLPSQSKPNGYSSIHHTILRIMDGTKLNPVPVKRRVVLRR